MFFTREDILKIQQALLQLGVKDSELPSAKPVTYDDILSIVQDGKNKKIRVKDFCNQISLWKREDFINITDKYDKHYISLIKAINLVPILQRKDGLVITFQDVEGNWEIYQFRGNITEFFEENKWFNLYDYRNNIIQSIVPDEEDLTASIPDEKGNSLVSLKDRVYDPTSFSGKGHKILRKNIQSVNIAVTKIKVEFSPSSDGTLSFSINDKETQVPVSVSVDNTTTLVADKIATKLTETMTEYEVSKDASTITLIRKFGGIVSTPSSFSAVGTGVSCSVEDSSKTELRNILTQDMIYQPNTIYEIRYDFDLNGEIIEMQEGTVLKFNGGSLRNGKINSRDTLIKSEPYRIFYNVELLGAWSSTGAFSEWFGAVVSNSYIIDNSIPINIALSIFKTVILRNGTYFVRQPVMVNSDRMKLYGSGNTTIKASNDFDVVTDDSISKLDGYYDFHNAVVMMRPGTYKDNYGITTDLIHCGEISNLKIDGSEIVPIGLEAWLLYSNIYNLSIINTNEVALVLRRGWNNRFSNIICSNNNGNGIEIGSEANSTLLERICIDHFGDYGLILNSGTNIVVQNINIEIGRKYAVFIENKTYRDLKNVCSSYADANVGSVTICGLWIENLKDEDSVGVRISNSDGVIVQSAFFNQIAHAFHVGGSLRRGIIIYPYNAYNTGNSKLSYINNRFKGDECNILIYDYKKLWEFEQGYEPTQVSFVRNSTSGLFGVNGLNIGVPIGQLREIGDITYDAEYNDLLMYNKRTDTPNLNFLRFTSWNRMAIVKNGISFELYYINGLIFAYVHGTATDYFQGDITFDAPYFNYGSKIGTFAYDKKDESDATVETRTYNAIYLVCKQNDIIKRSALYPVFEKRETLT